MEKPIEQSAGQSVKIQLETSGGGPGMGSRACLNITRGDFDVRVRIENLDEEFKDLDYERKWEHVDKTTWRASLLAICDFAEGENWDGNDSSVVGIDGASGILSDLCWLALEGAEEGRFVIRFLCELSDLRFGQLVRNSNLSDEILLRIYPDHWGFAVSPEELGQQCNILGNEDCLTIRMVHDVGNRLTTEIEAEIQAGVQARTKELAQFAEEIAGRVEAKRQAYIERGIYRNWMPVMLSVKYRKSLEIYALEHGELP